MKKIITVLALTLAISSNVHANEAEANRYQSAYNFLTFVEDRTNWDFSWLKTPFARHHANLRYGKLRVNNSNWLNDNVKHAWIQGHTGQDTSVAVVDSYTTRFANEISHGDKSAAIIGGTNTYNGRDYIGIAPDADITKTHQLNTSLTHGYDVINFSKGDSRTSYTRDIHDDYRYDRVVRLGSGLHENTLLVKSAGNGGSSCFVNSYCSLASLNLTTDETISDQVLIVGAVNEDNELYWYSNKAGNTMNNFVVDTSEYRIGNQAAGGTSAAAPTVSGKALLIKSKFNNLNGSQLANIIKTTADDLGSPGVDHIYGHGKVNLERALSPVGGIN